MDARLNRWSGLLKEAYRDVLGVKVQENEITYIQLDEKIHVYAEPYVCEKLDAFQLSEELLSNINHAIVWRIRYTSPMEYLRNSIDIEIYFYKEKPKYMQYDFEKDYPDYVDEKEFMENFMKILHCKFKETKNGYVIDKAIDGYMFYQRNEYSNIYWIREDVYKENYKNVIEKFMTYTGNERYLGEPICTCPEFLFSNLE
jgi:hypothetical protein